jgi:uncharacterized Zn-binding protein involved in type VI secretion
MTMSYKRYYIRDGATTTAGGTVRASAKLFKLDGVALALEGDAVDCPACSARGIIKCAAPRIPHRFQGKEFALSDDLCVCGCQPSPKLVSDQKFKFQAFATSPEEAPDKSALGKISSSQSACPSGVATNAKLVRLRFVDSVSAKPCVNRPYRLALMDGKVVQGVTNATGHTRPLTPEERSGLKLS